MEETTVQGFFPPMMSDMLIMLSIVLNVILMFAVAYLMLTRNQDGKFRQLDDRIKRVANDLKILDEKVRGMKPPKKVDTVPEAQPFGINPNAPREDPSDPSGIWKRFVDNYNFLAASMMVPGQLKACQKFVEDNGLRMLKYAGMMNFIPALDVEDSNFWLWKISPDLNQYAVVPNPMKPCDNELYERGGLKIVFAMNYKDGIYKKYVVDTPAIFTIDNSNQWKLQDPGVVDLERK